MLPEGLTLDQDHFSGGRRNNEGKSQKTAGYLFITCFDFNNYVFFTLVLFTLSLQKKHVRVDGPLLDILLDSLEKHTIIRLTSDHKK